MLIIVPKTWQMALVHPRFAKTDLGLANWRIGFWFIRKPGERY